MIFCLSVLRVKICAYCKSVRRSSLLMAQLLQVYFYALCCVTIFIAYTTQEVNEEIFV